MGKKDVCKTISISNIHMRMFDGQVRTLTNVRHVPDLKKNLLSLGTLEAREFKFSGADRAIEVTKSSMTILKGRTTNLYKLTESVIIGDALAAAKKEDTTRLWHMYFGHMSE